MATRRAAPRRRFRTNRRANRRHANPGQRFSRHSILVRGQRLVMVGSGREPHFKRLAVGVVQQPARCPDGRRGVARQRFAGIAPAFAFFCRSSRSSRSGQCLQGICWNVCGNVCRSSRSSGPFQSGEQVIKPHCPPRAARRHGRDRRAPCARRRSRFSSVRPSRSLWGSRRRIPARRAPA